MLYIILKFIGKEEEKFQVNGGESCDGCVECVNCGNTTEPRARGVSMRVKRNVGVVVASSILRTVSLVPREGLRAPSLPSLSELSARRVSVVHRIRM